MLGWVPARLPRCLHSACERVPRGYIGHSGARVQGDFRSQHHNIPGLLRRQPAPLVHLHPRDAGARGIADGGEVAVATERGRMKCRAHVTVDVLPGVVEVSMGGGGVIGPPAWQQSNVNELTDTDNRDPLSGFPVFKALLCEVIAAT